LPENLTAVLPHRRADFTPKNMAYGGVFGPFVVVVLGRSGPNERRLLLPRSDSDAPPDRIPWKSSLPVDAVRTSTYARKVTILLRFRFDGEDQGWSIGRPHPDPEPEPEPARLSRHDQIEFLRLVHDGLGRLMACSQMKVSERALKRTLTHSLNFRRALEHVEQMRAENLFAILYASALGGDTQSARFLLNRHDQSRRDDRR
jgi:predicted DNA-binding protein (UPF0251 family)